MRQLLRVVCGSILLVAASSEAQEQRGSITGTVKTASGSALPHVTVEARSPSLVGVATTETDAQGVYRFPASPPGRYEVTATFQGFKPEKAGNINLESGQTLRVDLTLQPIAAEFGPLPVQRQVAGVAPMALGPVAGVVQTAQEPVAAVPATPGHQIDGKTLFTEKRCNTCHSVDSEGIPASGPFGKETFLINWTRAGSCPDCGPDLSTIGDRRQDAKWLKAYLRCEKKGRNRLKHDELPMLLPDGTAMIMGRSPFVTTMAKVTDEEIDALVSWLVTLKTRKE